MPARRVFLFADSAQTTSGKSKSSPLWAVGRDKRGRFIKAGSRRAVTLELYSRRDGKTAQVRSVDPRGKEGVRIKKARLGKRAKAVLSFLPNRAAFDSAYVTIISSIPRELLAFQLDKPPIQVRFHYWVDGAPRSIFVRLPGGSKFGSRRITTKFGKKWQSNLRKWLIDWLKKFNTSASESKIQVVGFEPFWPKLQGESA